MKKEKFTLEQREDLLKSTHIHRCGAHSVTFTKDFKLLAVRRYNEEGLSAKQIFLQAGLDLQLLGKYLPKNCLVFWNKVYRGKKNENFNETRGKMTGRRKGRPKKNGMTDAEKIEHLEATVAYLKAENDFLAKLRAKRRE